ncbi:MAG: hypothetical protein OSJ52_08690, partial [Lachnospiraceae bacterium]|nr:hypothetical protein [Lachnospiraceae bacterium]
SLGICFSVRFVSTQSGRVLTSIYKIAPEQLFVNTFFKKSAGCPGVSSFPLLFFSSPLPP